MKNEPVITGELPIKCQNRGFWMVGDLCQTPGQLTDLRLPKAVGACECAEASFVTPMSTPVRNTSSLF